MNGTIGNVSIVAGGTANVLVLGIEEAASINLGGAASTVLGFTNGAWISEPSYASLGMKSEGLRQWCVPARDWDHLRGSHRCQPRHLQRGGVPDLGNAPHMLAKL